MQPFRHIDQGTAPGNVRAAIMAPVKSLGEHGEIGMCQGSRPAQEAGACGCGSILRECL